MSKLNALDDVRGTMKMLSLLHHDYRPFTRVELLDEMNSQKIGRTAAYKAIKALVDIGLLNETQGVNDGKRVLNTYPTQKGFLIAEKIIELEKILEEQ
jgi:Fe2+ or Zn2+ uptake regulation protein